MDRHSVQRMTGDTYSVNLTKTGARYAEHGVQTMASDETSFDESIPSADSQSGDEEDGDSSWLSYGETESRPMGENDKIDTSKKKIMDHDVNMHESCSSGSSENESDFRSVDSVECDDKLDVESDQEMPIIDKNEANRHSCGKCLRSFYSLEAAQLHRRLGYCSPQKVHKLKRRRRRKWFSCDQCLRKFRDAEAYSMHVNLCKANILIDMVENWSRITGDNGDDVYTCTLCARSYHDLKTYHLHNISALHKRRLHDSDKTSLLSDERYRAGINKINHRSKQIRNTKTLSKIKLSYKYRKGKKSGSAKPIGLNVRAKDSDRKPFVYTCDFCNKKFNNVHALKLHQSSEKHRKQDRKLGNMCNAAEYTTNDHVIDFENTRADRVSNRYQCPTCLRQYTNERALKIHSVLTCNGNKFELPELHTCDVCYKTFQNLRALRIHQSRRKHRPQAAQLVINKNVTLNATDVINKLQVLRCKDCSKTFSNLLSMKIHQGRLKHTLGYTIDENTEPDRNCYASNLDKTLSNSNQSSINSSSDLAARSHSTVSEIYNKDMPIAIGSPEPTNTTQSETCTPQIELIHMSSALAQRPDMTDSVDEMNKSQVLRCKDCSKSFSNLLSMKIHQGRLKHTHGYTIDENTEPDRNCYASNLDKTISNSNQSSINPSCDLVARSHSTVSEISNNDMPIAIGSPEPMNTTQSETCTSQIELIHTSSGLAQGPDMMDSVDRSVSSATKMSKVTYTCPVCLRMFPKLHGLKIHQLRSGHESKEEIEKRNKKHRLSQDRNVLQKSDSFPCFICLHGFSSTNSLKIHLKLVHNSELPSSYIESVSKNSVTRNNKTCDVCKRQFGSTHALNIHQSWTKHQQGEEQFEIPIKSIVTKGGRLVGLSGRKHSCFVCHRQFKTHVGLLVHQARADHKQIKPKLEIKQKHLDAGKEIESSSGNNNSHRLKIRLPTITCHASDKDFPYRGMIKDQQDLIEQALVNDDPASAVPIDNTTNQQSVRVKAKEEVKEELSEDIRPSVINKYVCAICGQSFSTWHGLRIHQVQMKHEQINKMCANPPTPVPVSIHTHNYKCNVCDFKFDEYHALYMHQRLSKCHLKSAENGVPLNEVSGIKTEVPPPTAIEHVSMPVVSLGVPSEIDVRNSAIDVSCELSEVRIPTPSHGIVQRGGVLEASVNASTDSSIKSYRCSDCLVIVRGCQALHQHRLQHQNPLQRNPQNNVLTKDKSSQEIPTKMQHSADNICPGAVSKLVIGSQIQTAPIDLTIRSIGNNKTTVTVPTSQTEIHTGNRGVNVLLQDAVWTVANPESPTDETDDTHDVARDQIPWIIHEYIPRSDIDSPQQPNSPDPSQKPKLSSIPCGNIRPANCQITEPTLLTSANKINQSPVIPRSDDASDCILGKSPSESISHYRCSLCSQVLPNKRAFDFHIFVEHAKESSGIKRGEVNESTVTSTKLLNGTKGQKCTVRYYAAREQKSEKPIMRTSTVIQNPLRDNVVQCNVKSESKYPYTPLYHNSSPSVISISDDESDDNCDDETPSKCKICNAVFASREVFEEHKLIHIKEEAMRVFGLS